MIFHLGPLGDLRELPPIERDQKVDATPTAPIAQHQSLEGAGTSERMGPYRRSWSLPWLYLTGAEAGVIRTLASGRLGGPLWLLDPQVPNLAPQDIATGGGERKAGRGWGSDVGPDWARVDTPPRGIDTVGAIVWTRPGTAVSDLSAGRVRPSQRVPAPPWGGQVSGLSVVRRTSATPVQVMPGWDGFTRAGVRTTVWGSPRTLGTDWTELLHDWTPPATIVGLSPAWRIAAGQPASVVQVAAVTFGYGPVPPAHSDGGGAALVTVPQGGLKIDYPAEGEWNVTLALDEL